MELKRTAVMVLVVFTWFIFNAQYPSAQTAEETVDKLQQGKESYEQGDYENSIQRLEEYLTGARPPREKRAEAYYFLAKNYYAAAPEKVEDVLRKAFETDWFISIEEKDVYFKMAADAVKQEYLDNIQVEQYLKNADGAFEKGAYDEAKYLYRLISLKLPGKTFEQQIKSCDETRAKKQEVLGQVQNLEYEKAYVALKGLLKLSPQDEELKAAAARIETQKILPLIETAETFFGDKNYRDALPLFEKILIFMPDHPEVLRKAAECREMSVGPRAAGKPIEKEGPQKNGKKKKFPVLLVLLGTAAVGTALYFLLKKKKQPAPTTGTINVQSSPTGARIWLDNIDTGLVTNATLTAVTAGSHTLKLVKESYLDYQVTIDVEAGKETVLSATLSLAPTPNFVASTDTVTIPEGGQNTFQVKLSVQPVSTVNASVSWISGDTDIAIVSGQALTFTVQNWDSYQAVTLRAIDDEDAVNGEAIFRISAGGIPNKDLVAVEQDLGGPGYLTVTPTGDFSATGAPGGPFSPTNQTYILENTGTGSIHWTASPSTNWVSLSLIGGRLEPNTSTAVTVSINNNANTLPVGTHTGTITFLNTTNGGGSTTRTVSLIITSPDNPPTINITNPTNNQTISGTVTVQATASDDTGVSKVEIYIDSVLNATLTNSPYTYQWNTTTVGNGSHTLKATAYDTINQTTSHQVSVTVNNT